MQLTFHDIERAFEIKEKVLYQWLNARGMPAVKANDQYYFNAVDVLEWALKARVPLTPGALKLCEQSRQGQDIITPALARGGIHFDIKGTAREAVLTDVLGMMPLPGHIQRPALLEMLLSREQMGTTAIGNGIAIPHVKHPVILAGLEPVVGVFFLAEKIDFDAFDKEPVHTLFVIFSSSFKGHLALLARLAFCLQDERVVAALAGRSDAAAILAAFQVAEARSARTP